MITLYKKMVRMSNLKINSWLTCRLGAGGGWGWGCVRVCVCTEAEPHPFLPLSSLSFLLQIFSSPSCCLFLSSTPFFPFPCPFRDQWSYWWKRLEADILSSGLNPFIALHPLPSPLPYLAKPHWHILLQLCGIISQCVVRRLLMPAVYVISGSE